MKRGLRIVHSNKELTEKLGRCDLCPCGSGRWFKRCCRNAGRFDGSDRGHYFQGNDKKPRLAFVVGRGF